MPFIPYDSIDKRIIEYSTNVSATSTNETAFALLGYSENKHKKDIIYVANNNIIHIISDKMEIDIFHFIM